MVKVLASEVQPPNVQTNTQTVVATLQCKNTLQQMIVLNLCTEVKVIKMYQSIKTANYAAKCPLSVI